MKTFLVLASALAVAACGADGNHQQEANGSKDQSAKPLPHFEFRGLQAARTTLDQAQEREIVEDCLTSELDGQKSTGCSFKGYQVGDVPTGRARVDFENGIFDWFSIEFSTDYFQNMVEQTRQVYGEPCETSSQELENAYGAQFSGDEVRWCFIEGQLVVRRHSRDNFRLGEFEFFTEKPERPRKTYDANTL
jgi:hypothetical protein